MFKKIKVLESLVSLSNQMYVIFGLIMGATSSYFSPITNSLGIPLSLFLFGSIGIILFLLIRLLLLKRPKKIAKLNQVIRKEYNSETVILDGNHFVSCIFNSCTLEYIGGDFVLDNSDIKSDCKLRFKTKESRVTAQLLFCFVELVNDDVNNGRKSNMFMLDEYGRFSKNIQILDESKTS